MSEATEAPRPGALARLWARTPWGRLAQLEADRAALKQTQSEILEGITKLAGVIVEEARGTNTCGRCSVKLDVKIARRHGPRVVEREVDGQMRQSVVCSWCMHAAKSDGWRVVIKAVEVPAAAGAPS